MSVSASLLAGSAAIRIASLNLCADEYLLMLARPQQVASVSRLAGDRRESPLWRVARRFPANRGTLETALATNPTTILTMGGSGRSTALLANRMGLTTVDLPYPSTIADVRANMRRVAEMTGQYGALRRWERRLDALTPPKDIRDAAFVGQGGLSVGTHSLSAEWMLRAGFRQADLPQGRLTLERMLTAAPHILLRSNYRAYEASLGRRRLDHPLVRHAASQGIGTDGRVWTCSGPLMAYEMKRLQHLR